MNLNTIFNNPISRSTGFVILITVGIKAFGYIEKVLLAYYFGTGPEVDAYLVVVTVVFSVFIVVREIIEPGFLKTFMKLHAQGEPFAAWKLFNQVWMLILLLVVPLIFFGVIFPEAVATIFAPGFEQGRHEMAASMMRIGLPAITFLAASALTYITLNGQKKFVVPSLGDLVMKVLGILILISLFQYLGISAAVLGLLVGAIGRLLVHLIHLYPHFSLPQIEITQDLRQFFRLSWPLMIGVAFSQASLLLDNLWVSFEENGAISALSFAKKLVELPILLLPYTLGIVIFPFFTDLANTRKTAALKSLLATTLKWIFLFFLPLALWVFLFRHPIVQVAFERGAFDSYSTQLTIQPLAVYAVGMPTFAIETILVLFFFANGDTKRPIAVGIGCAILNIFLTWTLIQKIGYNAVPCALVISKSIKLIILGVITQRSMNYSQMNIIRFCSKGLAALIPAGIILYWLYEMLHGWPASTGTRLMLLGSSAVLAYAIFGVTLYLLGVRFQLFDE